MNRLKFLSAFVSLCILMPLTVSAEFIYFPKIYKYESRYDEDDDSWKFFTIGDSVIRYTPIVSGWIGIREKKGYYPSAAIYFCGTNERLVALCKKCEDTVNVRMMSCEATIDFVDGESLTFDAEFFDCRTMYVKDAFHDITGYGALYISLPNVSYCNKKRSLPSLDKDSKARYVANVFRHNNIKRLTIGDYMLEFTVFPTAATFNAMFNTLKEKTGSSYEYYDDTNLQHKSLEDDLITKKDRLGIPSAEVRSIKTEHNYRENGKKGMYVTVSFDVNNMKGRTGEAIAYFYYENGQQLRDFNNNYYTTNGYVCASTKFTPSYDFSTYNGVQIFIPYTELHLSSGISHLKTWVAIFDDKGNKIGESNWSKFRWSSTGNF